MRNNRGVKLDDKFIAKHKLSTDPPPEDSLFWTLWNQSNEIAKDALATPFIQGIKNADLDPVTYGGFNVSDAYYCFKGADDYRTAANKTNDPTLKAFLMKKHDSYEKYNKTFPKIWHVKDADGLSPSIVCKAYSDFESRIASGPSSIYTLIAMLPCEYLWAWIAGELNPTSEGNLYEPWITGNNDPSGAYAMGNFIDMYSRKHEGVIDPKLARKIYEQAMYFEFRNFETA